MSTTLEELNKEADDDETLSEGGDIVDLTIGDHTRIQRLTGKKKSRGMRRNNTALNLVQGKQTAAKQLAAGWRIVNERLKDIEQLERRNHSRIKYEVDKAFEMAKYLDETNLSSRDPATSHAYTSMVQMCVQKLD